jgi:hypothetical protein
MGKSRTRQTGKKVEAAILTTRGQDQIMVAVAESSTERMTSRGRTRAEACNRCQTVEARIWFDTCCRSYPVSLSAGTFRPLPGLVERSFAASRRTTVPPTAGDVP